MAVLPDGETRLYLILGDPISQVKSPALVSAALARRQVNALVLPAQVSATSLDAAVSGLSLVKNLDGFLVTVPHKQAMAAYCSELSETARFAGSVNVMRRAGDNRWIGDNTDGKGYIDGIAACGFEMRGKRALLVGAGGAGSAIAFEILMQGATALAVHDINIPRRDAAIARLSERFPGRVNAGGADPEGYDFVGNASTAGMREDDPLPVQIEKLRPSQFVADVITKPAMTPFLSAARERGCRFMTGIGMVEAQQELLASALLPAMS